MKKNKAFNGSEHRPGIQHRITPQDPDSQVLNRTTLKQIPRRLEALYIAFAKDAHNSDLILTREELDLNPATRLLPDREKDLLVQYWPTFQDKATTAMQVAKARIGGVKLLSKDHKEANSIKRKHGINDTLSESDQLRATSHVCARVFKETAITLAASRPIDEETSDLEKALWTEREKRARAMAHFAKVSIDLAVRLEEITTDEMQSAGLTDEAQQALLDADAKLHELGYGHFSSSFLVVDDGDEE